MSKYVKNETLKQELIKVIESLKGTSCGWLIPSLEWVVSKIGR